MISLTQALKALRGVWRALEVETVPLYHAVGRVLAQDVEAPLDLPPFASAAMDGIAVAFPPGHCTLPPGWEVQLVGEVRAGSAFPGTLHPGEGVRIYTGAPLPPGAHAVVMREHLSFPAPGIARIHTRIRRGEHIRRRGEEVRKGQRVMTSGQRLTPAGVGALAALGVPEVRVYRRPRVVLFTTGDEVVMPGSPRGPGQVYNVHAFSLRAAMGGLVASVEHRHLPDRRDAVEEALETALREAEVVLFTGGVSVGDYDFVRDVLDRQVERVFYRVAQKPGKPLYLGRKGSSLVFGLPGNPASALVCFYLYVYPTLRALGGDPRPEMVRARYALEKGFVKKSGRAWIVWAVQTSREGKARILPAQHSHRMATYSRADLLLVLPSRRVRFRPGERVWGYRLPEHGAPGETWSPGNTGTFPNQEVG